MRSASVRRALAALTLVLTLSTDARASSTLPAEVRRALAWQLALEREGFSPGLIDGNPGAKTSLATAEYQRARGLAVNGKLDSATAAALAIDNSTTVLATYIVRQEDVQLVNPPPTSWVAKSKAKVLGYESLADCVAEKFHCSEAFLASLNPQLRLDGLKAGDRLAVPAVHDPRALYADRLEINLSQKVIRAYEGNAMVGLFHCSIAKEKSKRPTGEARITGVTANPAYSFDPAMWPEVKDVNQKLLIPPGPRNPVGLCWMSLSLPGYGIHGTPHPEMIGKTGSHGCFRLTNWDAVRLGRMAPAGTVVKFVPAASGAVAQAN